MKTNKSYSNRLKVTRKGKIIGRRPGQNHFNAKESRSAQLKKKQMKSFYITRKQKARFLPNQ